MKKEIKLKATSKIEKSVDTMDFYYLDKEYTENTEKVKVIY